METMRYLMGKQPGPSILLRGRICRTDARIFFRVYGQQNPRLKPCDKTCCRQWSLRRKFIQLLHPLPQILLRGEYLNRVEHGYLGLLFPTMTSREIHHYTLGVHNCPRELLAPGSQLSGDLQVSKDVLGLGGTRFMPKRGESGAPLKGQKRQNAPPSTHARTDFPTKGFMIINWGRLLNEVRTWLIPSTPNPAFPFPKFQDTTFHS